MYAPEQLAHLEQIRQMPHDELVAWVDKGISQKDEEARIVGYDYISGKPNGYLGHIDEESLAETILNGTIEFLDRLDWMVGLGYIDSRDAWGEMPLDGIDQVRALIRNDSATHEYPSTEYAEDELHRALNRMYRKTDWVRRDGWGWRLTPKGLAHLDGALDQVVEL